MCWLAIVFAATAGWAQSDPNDPPTRIARLAYLQGGVSLHPAGAEEWVDAGLNRPLTVGDQLWSDRGGRIEMQLDGSNVRLGAETSAGLLNLTDETTQIQLSSGSMIVHVQQLDDDESYEIDTPNVAFSILRPGTYRLTVDPDGQSTAIAVRSGQGEAVGGAGVGYTVRAGEQQTFSGVDDVEADNVPMAPQDEFDRWCAQRDDRFDHSQSAQYVSPDVVGYQELDSQGNWDDTPEYGHVWFPTAVDAGWAPYHYGHWAYIAPWGYTWVDDRNWGFAPFHYGRWVYWRQRWGWVPAPPRAPNVVYVRPVYAPALVAWVGTGATLAWFPLAPREVFIPSYPVSRRYLNVVNVSNTRINTTVINNVYNTTIINRTTINNVTYANRRVPGAVIAADSQALATARPIRGNQGVDRRTLDNAPVRAFAPAVVPARAAVFGGRGMANVRPPQAVQTRVTEARMAPAAAAPSIDARLQALRDSRGRAPAPAQPARDPAQNPPAAPNVRVVPPVRTLVNSRQLENARTQAAQTPPAPVAAPARPPVHVNELPAPTRGPSPGGADSVLERQQAQEQQRLQASQEAERLLMQQQQDLEHRRLAQPPGEQRRQPLDPQRSAQEQAQSQAQAELQRSQQAQQQRNAQLEQLQRQQSQEQQRQNQVQAQAQQQAEQQRAQQLQQQRQLEQQVQQQHAAQLEQQQRAQQAEQQRQAQLQAQAQQQAQQQRNVQLDRQRDQQQAQLQRQQIEAQHQQQTQQLQQQQARAQQELLQRQQAAQAQQQQQPQPVRRPAPPNQRQP